MDADAERLRLVNYVYTYNIYIVLKCLILSNVNHSSLSLPPDHSTHPPLMVPPLRHRLVQVVIISIITLSHYLNNDFDILFDLFSNDSRTSVQTYYCITYRVHIFYQYYYNVYYL